MFHKDISTYLCRKELELTDLALPDRIVKLACENCKIRDREQGVTRYKPFINEKISRV
jgi:hypothetical protein